MLKYARWILYLVVFILLGFYIWHNVSQKHHQQSLQAFQKDLFLTQVKPTKAPNFTLVDQHQKKVTLTAFKGKKIVLQFMDPKCTDVCPLISEEIINANKLLGTRSHDVVYLAVNVNEYHNKVADVAAFSSEHGLSQLDNWYFLTGTPDQLKSIWKAYHIEVVPSKDGDVQHTSAMYFINRKGKEVYMGQPQNEKPSIPEWSKAISFIVEYIQ